MAYDTLLVEDFDVLDIYSEFAEASSASRVLVKERSDHLLLSTEDRTTAKQLISNACVLSNGQAFVTFHPFIEWIKRMN